MKEEDLSAALTNILVEGFYVCLETAWGGGCGIIELFTSRELKAATRAFPLPLPPSTPECSRV